MYKRYTTPAKSKAVGKRRAEEIRVLVQEEINRMKAEEMLRPKMRQPEVKKKGR